MMSLMCCYSAHRKSGSVVAAGVWRMFDIQTPPTKSESSVPKYRCTYLIGDFSARCRKEVDKFLTNSPLAKFLDASRRRTRSNIWWKQYVDTERAQEMNLSLWISMDPTYGKWFQREEAVMSKSWMPFQKKGVICCLVHDDITTSEFINRAELGCEEFYRWWNSTDGCKGLRKRAGWVRWKGYYVIWAEF